VWHISVPNSYSEYYDNYSPTHLPWNRGLLEKLIVTKLINEKDEMVGYIARLAERRNKHRILIGKHEETTRKT